MSRFYTFRFVFLFTLLVLQSLGLKAQILDDSTTMKYGVSSVIMQSEEAVYYNDSVTFQHPYNGLNGVHVYQSLFLNNRYAQDLGNYLTPRGIVVPVLASGIGTRYGFEVFDDFSIRLDSMKLYDTRSPYTHLDYTQGGKGQQKMMVTHSRNITSRWNATVVVHRLASKKLLGRLTKVDPQAENWGFALGTRYYSKSARYQVFGKIASMSHKHFDQGGIVPDSGEQNMSELYDYELERVALYGVSTLDRRVNARVYQQYNIVKDSSLQVFNQLDIASRYNRYQDRNVGNHDEFYPALNYDSVHTFDRVDYMQGDAKLGVKGTSSLLFYALYYKARYYNYKLLRNPYQNKEGINNILGGEVMISLPKSLRAGVQAELAPASVEHDIRAKITHRFFELHYKQLQFSPTLQQQQWYGNHIAWNNDFSNISASQLSGRLHYRYKSFAVSPSSEWTTWGNYVYYNRQALPVQYNEAINVASSSLDLSITKKNWIIENSVQYNFSSHDRIIRIPEWINRSRLVLQGYLFKKATFMQIGVDLFFRSEWIGNKYMPVTQVYYLGNANDPLNRLESYVLADLFINMQVKSTRFFVKMAYINQDMGSAGYMVTPYYSGMPRTFEFGINWQFFD